MEFTTYEEYSRMYDLGINTIATFSNLGDVYSNSNPSEYMSQFSMPCMRTLKNKYQKKVKK